MMLMFLEPTQCRRADRRSWYILDVVLRAALVMDIE